MALVVDAGAIYAQADAADPGQDAVRRVLLAERETLITTELAAEADYVILDRLGVDVEKAFVGDHVAGTFVVESLSRDELKKAPRSRPSGGPTGTPAPSCSTRAVIAWWSATATHASAS
jgi:hypothetical protein